MDEKFSKRPSRQIPLSYRTVYTSQRSRSLSTEKEQSPSEQHGFTMEHRLCTPTRIDRATPTERKPNVAELIKRFEEIEAIESVKSSHTNRNHSSNYIRHQYKRSPSYEILSSSTSFEQELNNRARFIRTTSQTVLNSIEQNNIRDIRNIPVANVPTKTSQNKPRDPIHAVNVKLGSRLLNSMNTTQQNRVPRADNYIKCQNDEYEGVLNNESNVPERSNTNNDSSNVPTSSNDETKESDIKKATGFTKRIEEIYTTEENYVKKLFVLAFTVPKTVNMVCSLDDNLLKSFNDTFKPLLVTIKQLYEFHHDKILPNMLNFRVGYRSDNIWSIFEEHFEKIESLYKEYYIVYDEHQQKIERLCATNPLLHDAMLKCQVHLGNLYPINELNCANQHLLRYILMMKNYMKHVNENSSEYERTCFIHDELNGIAERCEEQLAVSPTQLNKLKQRLDSKVDCFEKQQLIWYGSLKRQASRKPTDISQVYLILFSECILVCGESGSKLEVKRQLPMKNIRVEINEGDGTSSAASNALNGQQSIPALSYPFRLSAVEKIYDFLVDKEVDREKWINKIRQASDEYKRRNSTIEIRQSCPRPDDQKLGTRAPVWVNDADVTRCQLCHNQFASKPNNGSRRHHCRSCGRCVCQTCSTRKLILKYCNKQGEVRVCDVCHQNLTGINRALPICIRATRDPNKTILFGDFRYFHTRSVVWIELQEDFHLRIYGGKLDIVEDFSINLLEINDILFMRETQTFILNVKDKTYKFSLEINHQLKYPKNDYIDKNLKNTANKLFFYANLWYDTMQSARLRTTPLWYIRKRDSADSGISTN